MNNLLKGALIAVVMSGYGFASSGGILINDNVAFTTDFGSITEINGQGVEIRINEGASWHNYGTIKFNNADPKLTMRGEGEFVNHAQVLEETGDPATYIIKNAGLLLKKTGAETWDPVKDKSEITQQQGENPIIDLYSTLDLTPDMGLELSDDIVSSIDEAKNLLKEKTQTTPKRQEEMGGLEDLKFVTLKSETDEIYSGFMTKEDMGIRLQSNMDFYADQSAFRNGIVILDGQDKFGLCYNFHENSEFKHTPLSVLINNAKVTYKGGNNLNKYFQDDEASRDLAPSRGPGDKPRNDSLLISGEVEVESNADVNFNGLTSIGSLATINVKPENIIVPVE